MNWILKRFETNKNKQIKNQIKYDYPYHRGRIVKTVLIKTHKKIINYKLIN